MVTFQVITHVIPTHVKMKALVKMEICLTLANVPQGQRESTANVSWAFVSVSTLLGLAI